MTKRIRFPNGLRFLAVSLKSSKTVTVLVLTGTGSKYERKEESGISHFLEHMFFEGTRKRPTQLEIGEALEKVGGAFNGFTAKEYTGFWAKVSLEKSGLALDWISDILLNSKIAPKGIEKEKGVIAEEINLYLDTPIYYIHDLWEELLYGDQPAGRLILGEKENIKRFERKDFLGYLHHHYCASNTIVCVCGSIKPYPLSLKIKQYFKDIRENKPEEKLAVIEEQSKPRVLIHSKKTDQTHLCLGVRGYNLFDHERYAQSLLAVILGGMMSSRLSLSLQNRGLAYYVQTTSQVYTDTGYLVTSAGVSNKEVKTALQLILDEYRSLASKKIKKPELCKAKEFLKGRLSLGLETSDAWAMFFARQELLEDKISTPRQISEKIDQVTSDDILDVAKIIFSPKKLNLALIGPFERKQQFQKILDSF